MGKTTRLGGSGLALVWPAAAVSVLWLSGALYVRDERRGEVDRAALVRDAALLAATCWLGNRVTGSPLLVATTLTVANLVHPLVVIAVLRRWQPRLALRTPRDLQVLLGAAAAGATASGLVNVLSLQLLGSDQVPLHLTSLVARNVLSTFVLVGLGLRVGDTTGPGDRPSWRAVALLVVVGGIPLVVVFELTRGLPVAFLVLPVGVWVAARFATTVVAWYVAVSAAVVVLLSLYGRGPFAGGSVTREALLVQAFMTVSALLTLSLALQRDERDRLADVLRLRDRQLTEQTELLTTVFDTISDGVVVVDADGVFLMRNPAARRLLGRETGQGDPGTWGQYYGLTDLAGTPIPTEELPLVQALHGRIVSDVDLLVHNPESGESQVLSVTAHPLSHRSGRPGAIAAFHDVSVARRTAARVEQARDLFAGVLAAATEQAIIGTDPDGLITVFNVGAQRMLGYTEHEMLGQTPERLHDPAEVQARADELGIEPGFEVFVHEVSLGQADTRLWTYLTAHGQRLTVQLTVSTIRDSTGSIAGYIGLAADVTIQQHAEQALRDSEARFRSAFHTAPMGMFMACVDDQLNCPVTQVNPAMCELLGCSEQEFLSGGLLPYVHPDHRPKLLAARSALLHGPTGVGPAQLEVRFVRPDRSERWGILSASAIATTPDTPDGARTPGTPRQVISLIEDITARKHAEQSLRHQALHDGLTGLANRTLLQDRAEHALATAARSGRAVGLLFLDLDGFKAVNDLAGHAAGDELLVQTAQRLLASVRPGDTVSRLGGDEFAVLCPAADTPAHLTVVAQRVLAAVRAPVPLEAGTHTVSASIGMAIAKPGTTAAQLLHDADTAMYGAKRAGKDRLVMHDDADVARAARSVRLLPELAGALERDELFMYGQPVVDLATGTTIAVETLLRWQHPHRGILPPSEFLAVAEASPLMVPIGQRALHESCRQAARWLEDLGPDAPDVHVNVSGRQLESGNVSSDVLSALARYHLPADRLVLELTETHMPLLADSLMRDLQRLRDRGVRIAIDDLGTGYSSLSRLTELPVDILKIDTSFVQGLGQDPSCDAVVRAVLSIGQALGLSVVAEGIETPQQADTLVRYGCDTAQGYLYSPPRSERDLHDLLVRTRPGAGNAQTHRLDLRP